MREVARLAIEELYHLRPRDILGDIRVDARQAHANRTEGLAHDPLEVDRHQRQRRNDQADDQRQQPVLDEQDHHDANERQHIGQQRDRARSKHIVQRVHVIGDARHQATDGIVIEERERERLQVRKHRRAQVIHHLLADDAEDIVLEVAQPEADDEHE